MKRLFLLCASLMLCFLQVWSQQVFIRLNNPSREKNSVSHPRQYIIGSTCKTCRLTLNGIKQKVYPTGAFAIELDLFSGDTSFVLTAVDSSREKVTKKLSYYYLPPLPPQPTTTFSIESINTYPVGNLLLLPGDTIQIRIKALPGCKASWVHDLPLTELPSSQTNGMTGIYAGSYIVQPHDQGIRGKIKVLLQNAHGSIIVKETPYSFYLLPGDTAMHMTTIDNMTYLTSDVTGDRLGPSKIGYLDKGIPLCIVGKIGEYYKVRLANHYEAFIPSPLVEAPPDTLFAGLQSITAISAAADNKFDYLSLALSGKLPYQSIQETAPTRLVVNVFGALLKTAMPVSLKGLEEIRRITTEQVQPDLVRLIIDLKHPQHWGHSIYYEADKLFIKVKRPPKEPDLSHLIIGVDAGHGGSNPGAMGPTGVHEKQLTLEIALKLQAALEREGAQVIMTRTKDIYFDNEDRVKFYRRADPDLLISVHLNSAGDPIHVKGTATYYKHPGFKPLTTSIYNRMKATGLNGFGNFGNFNFILNTPAEFPNVLVEALFLSNPEEEMLALEPLFQERMAAAIVQGIKDFLEECAKNKSTLSTENRIPPAR